MTDRLELGDVYGTTIERIRAQDGDKSRLGMAALMWVGHSERLLLADELCHALAVEIGSVDFNPSNVPSISTLVGCCQGFISVDKEASTVRLIHLTLQEYLSLHHNTLFSRPHSTIAEICLTYLNSQQVKALSAGASPGAQNTPFLKHCSVYWGIHAKRELSDCEKSLTLELLKGDYGEIATRSLIGRVDPYYARGWDTYSPFGGLHCASFFGIVELVTTLIEIKYYDINEGDFSGCTLLGWAAHNGHEEVVKMLLGREGVKLDKPDSFGQTPLSHAAWTGHEGVVKILLGWEGVNPIGLIERAKHRSRMLLGMHTRKWSEYYLDARKSIPTSLIRMAKRNSRLPPRVDMGWWWESCSKGKKSISTGLIRTAKRRSCLPPGVDMREW